MVHRIEYSALYLIVYHKQVLLFFIEQDQYNPQIQPLVNDEKIHMLTLGIYSFIHMII